MPPSDVTDDPDTYWFITRSICWPSYHKLDAIRPGSMARHGKLAMGKKIGYIALMVVTNFDDGHLSRQPPRKTLRKAPASWAETIRESDQDIASGRVVPIDDVLKELDEVIAGMEPSPALKP